MPSQVELLFWSIFDRFLVPTSNPGSFKIMVFPWGKRWFFKNSPLEDSIDFNSILDANMPPKSIQNPSKCLKIDSQEASKFWSFFALIFYRFWLRFGGQVGAMLATKTATKTAQDGIWEPEPAQTPKMVPKWRPRPPKMMPQTPHFGSILASFWNIF